MWNDPPLMPAGPPLMPSAGPHAQQPKHHGWCQQAHRWCQQVQNYLGLEMDYFWRRSNVLCLSFSIFLSCYNEVIVLQVFFYWLSVGGTWSEVWGQCFNKSFESFCTFWCSCVLINLYCLIWLSHSLDRWKALWVCLDNTFWSNRGLKLWYHKCHHL